MNIRTKHIKTYLDKIENKWEILSIETIGGTGAPWIQVAASPEEQIGSESHQHVRDLRCDNQISLVFLFDVILQKCMYV